MRTQRFTFGVLLVGFLAVSAGCGGSGNPAGPSTPPPSGPTITITAAGVNPSTLTVAAGSRVRFVNQDTRSHFMTSDPHPEHTDCPEINQVGLLTAGQSRETGNLVFARTCGYHDHDQPSNAGLRGRIVIQ